MQIEVIDNDFDYPDNLREMTNDDREALGVRHAAFRNVHSAGRPTIESSPSRVMDIGEITRIREERAAALELRRRSANPEPFSPVRDEYNRVVGEFVPDVGYVINDNTHDVRNVSKEEAADLRNAAYEAEEIRKERERYSRMSEVEREAEDRFGDII
jgi:hypothetical protein